MKALRLTSDIRRIIGLPRRPVWTRERAERAAAVFTAHFKKPEGTMSLNPIQGAMLYDLVYHGLVGDVRVGGGKALVSLLFFRAVEAKRGLLVVPASVREQTKQDVIPSMLRHWDFPLPLVRSYSEISLAKNARFLDVYKPDAIALDEAQRLAHATSGRTKRVKRHLKANQHVQVCALSGTFIGRSVREMTHITNWCLGEGSPFPTRYNDIEDLANCVDKKVRPGYRVMPGALHKIMEPGQKAPEWYRGRVNETPGVVVSWETDTVGTPLIVTCRNDTPSLASGTLDLIAKVDRDWQDPHGNILPDALSVWRVIRQLSLGMFYRWRVPAPKPWLEARQDWNRHVQNVIRSNRRGLDTPLQVANEAKRDELPAYFRWREIKPTFTPEVECHWIDSAPIEAVCRWLTTTKGGLAWIEHAEFGHELARRGHQYLGAGPKSNAHLLWLSTHAHVPTVALSMHAHGEGKNLQRWSSNLFPTFPTSAKHAEQILGRTHRPGTEADEVTAEVWLPTSFARDSFDDVLAQAEHMKKLRGVEHKLTYVPILGRSNVAAL